jgi:glycosyltransferase involved in cell wall biosynthesis
MGDPLISVIIPTFKRYELLLNAIDSVRKQTYKNIEIIVVIDGENETLGNLGENVNVIRLPLNSTVKFGYPCVGYVRTMGILNSKGKYVSFLDDDDLWVEPDKLILQIEAMKRTGMRMSCSEAFVGNDDIYDKTKIYERYNLEKCYNYIKNVFRQKGKIFNGFPRFFDLEFIKINNSIITSTVIMERTLLDEIGYMPFLPYGSEMPEDYACWINALKYTKCVYIAEPPCIYYHSHSRGRISSRISPSRNPVFCEGKKPARNPVFCEGGMLCIPTRASGDVAPCP